VRQTDQLFSASPGAGSASQGTEEEEDEFIICSQKQSATEGTGAGLVLDRAGHSNRAGDPGAISVFRGSPGLPICSVGPEPEQVSMLLQRHTRTKQGGCAG